MDFIFNNPLVNLPGTQFLILYLLLIVCSLILFLIIKRSFDQSGKISIPQIPNNPNPFEIAYLRGGENEMLRSIVFSLVQKGFLKTFTESKKTFVGLGDNQPNWTLLSEIERQVMTWFQTTRNTEEIFAKNGLGVIIDSYFGKLQNTFEKMNLINSRSVVRKNRILSLIFWFFIAAIGGYKVIAALARGHSNVGFIFGIIVLSLVIFLIAGKTNRLSKLGKKYIAQIQTAFQGVKSQMQNSKTPEYQQAQGFYAFNPYVLAVGVFGVGALTGTQFNEFEQAFHKSNSVSGSSCGSSCGSGCSSGDGGCGGGCGGCS